MEQNGNALNASLTDLDISCFQCEYIFSLMKFILNNQENFQTNSGVGSIKDEV